MKNPSKYEPNANNLFVGDCREVLPSLPTGVADAIITDPPFNIGLDYDGYDDNKSPDDFLAMITEVAKQGRRVLKPTGCIWVFMGQAYQAETYLILRDAGLRRGTAT